MSWNFSNDVPIYLQIMEHFKVQIASGKLEVGDKIPPVRELALEAGVNPNTMQKALSELEREGYLESQRTSGRFVADRGKQIDRLKQDMALELCESFHNGMKKDRFTQKKQLQSIREYINRIEE